MSINIILASNYLDMKKLFFITLSLLVSYSIFSQCNGRYETEYSTTQNIDLCNGGSVTVGNNTYNSTGVYTDVFTTTNGENNVNMPS